MHFVVMGIIKVQVAPRMDNRIQLRLCECAFFLRFIRSVVSLIYSFCHCYSVVKHFDFEKFKGERFRPVYKWV